MIRLEIDQDKVIESRDEDLMMYRDQVEKIKPKKETYKMHQIEKVEQIQKLILDLRNFDENFVNEIICKEQKVKENPFGDALLSAEAIEEAIKSLRQVPIFGNS